MPERTPEIDGEKEGRREPRHWLDGTPIATAAQLREHLARLASEGQLSAPLSTFGDLLSERLKRIEEERAAYGLEHVELETRVGATPFEYLVAVDLLLIDRTRPTDTVEDLEEPMPDSVSELPEESLSVLKAAAYGWAGPAFGEAYGVAVGALVQQYLWA